MKTRGPLAPDSGLETTADIVRQICDSVDLAHIDASNGDPMSAYGKVRGTIARAVSLFRSGSIDRMALLQIATHCGSALNQIESNVATGVGMVRIPRVAPLAPPQEVLPAAPGMIGTWLQGN